MMTFVLGLIILIVGAALYGKFCEKVFGPDDRKTPAYEKEDGVDYVPMKGWKNSMINLLKYSPSTRSSAASTLSSVESCCSPLLAYLSVCSLRVIPWLTFGMIGIPLSWTLSL